MNRRLGQRGGCAALPRLALVAACVVAVVCATPQAGGEGPLEQTGGKALREALDSLWRTQSPQEAIIPAPAARLARETVLAATKSSDPLVSGAALVSLAESYETSLNPLGVPQNLTRSLELYELAAAKGSPAAQFALAALHLAGLFGAPKDIPQAITLLYFAAAGGLQEAQVALGWMHGTGRHVPKRCSSAVAYLLPAVSQIEAQTWSWGQAIRPSSFSLTDDMLVDPGADVRQRAMRYEFIQHKAAQGEAEAKQALAFVHFSGALGKRRDLRLAREVLEELVATAERPQDYSRLGHLLAEGYFASEDASTLPDGAGGSSRPDLAAAVRAVVGQHPADSGEVEEGDPVADPDSQTAELLLETAAGSGSNSAAAWLALLLLRQAGVLSAPDPRSLLWAADRPSHTHRAATLSMRALRVDGAFPAPAPWAEQAAPGGGAGPDGKPAASTRSSQRDAAHDGSAGGASQDPVERALGLLKSSSAGGDGGTKEAHYAIGVLLMRGIEAREGSSAVLKRSFKRAAKHFMTAAREGHLPSILALAKMRVHGLGLDRSCDMASHLLMEASHIGAGQDELVVAAARFAGGDPVGASAAWARGAAMGLDSAAWNLGILIDGAALADRQALSAETQASLSWSAFLAEPSLYSAAELADAALRGVSRAVSAWVAPTRSMFSPSGLGTPAEQHATEPAGDQRASGEQMTAAPAKKASSVFGSTEWARARLAAVLERPAQADVSADGEVAVSAHSDPTGDSGAALPDPGQLEVGHSAEAPRATDGAQAGPLPVTVGLLVAANATLGPSADLVMRAEAAAFALFDHAVASGANTRAGIMMGEYTLAGRAGTAGSTEAAAGYFRSAAARGNARALWTLGMLHETGEGLPLDWHLAKRFYDDAQASDAQSSGPAHFGRGRMWLKLSILRYLPSSWHESAVWLLEPVLGRFSRREPAPSLTAAGGRAGAPADQAHAAGTSDTVPVAGSRDADDSSPPEAGEAVSEAAEPGPGEPTTKSRSPEEAMQSLKQRMQRRAAKRAHSTRAVVAAVAAASDALEQTLEDDPELLVLGAAMTLFAAIYIIRAVSAVIALPPEEATNHLTQLPSATDQLVNMRAIIAVLLALGTAISARAAAIVLHATTVLRFTDLALGTSRGIYDTSVADNELLTLLCGAPEAPVAMVASCQVGGRVACESFSSMMAFTTVSHVAGDVRLTVEVAGVAIGDGGIVTDQQVECSLQKSTILDNAAWPKNTTVATAVARPWAVPMASVKATADFSMAGTVKAMVAPVAKYFKEHVVATADKLGPFEHETSIDVFSVDATGNACSPTSSLPYLVLDSVSSQEGPLSCQPIEGDDCLSARCVLPATTTRLSVTLRPSESNAFSHDPLFAEVLVVPSRTR